MTMLSDLERKQIDKALYNVDIAYAVNLAKASRNPHLLYELASNYNWADGLAVPTAIASNSDCDLGTALALFWNSSAIDVITGEISDRPSEPDWLAFCRGLIDKIQEGVYKIGPVSFYPGLNKIHLYKLRKAGVPSIFYTPVESPGLPPNNSFKPNPLRGSA
jgi:hypothetical protein